MPQSEPSDDVVVPSLEREAAAFAASFWVTHAPDLCRQFIQVMNEKGEEARKTHRSPSGGGRIRVGYVQYADWIQKALLRHGVPVATDPVEQSVLEGVKSNPVEPAEPLDPIEAKLFAEEKKVAPAPAPAPEIEPTPEMMADLLSGVMEDEARKAKRRDFVFEVCSKADELCEDLLASETKGLSALMRPPVIIEGAEGQKAVLVQSFTIPLKGVIVRHDYKANCRPVVVRHPNMFIQMDHQKLIRSKVLEKHKREFYVKGLDYVNGMIFKGYLEAGKRDREDLATYYQVRGNQIVKISEAEYRKFENLLAAGKDPDYFIPATN